MKERSSRKGPTKVLNEKKKETDRQTERKVEEGDW